AWKSLSKSTLRSKPPGICLARPGRNQTGSGVVFGRRPTTWKTCSPKTTPDPFPFRDGVDWYTFSIRGSEIRSTQQGIVLLGVVVDAPGGGTFTPEIAGLTPVSLHTEGGRTVALFAVTEPGLKLLQIRGTEPGSYSLELFIAGDVDGDGLVDGVDSALQTAALGSVLGESAYLIGADANRDGVINAADVQLLGGNFGFVANRPPSVLGASFRTYEDLEITIPLDDLAFDPEDDPLYFRVVTSSNGTASLTPDGRAVRFFPDLGFTGSASFDIQADDGFNRSEAATIDVHVSDAPLVHLDYVWRKPKLEVGSASELVLFGDFADQPGVMLPASYLQFSVDDTSVATVSELGRVVPVAEGSTVVTASRGDVQAVTVVSVGFPESLVQGVLYAFGMDAYPDAVTLPPGGTRTIQVSLFEIGDYTDPSMGTRYFATNPDVAIVSADGVVTGIAPGLSSIVIVNGPAEVVVPVKIEEPVSGPAILTDQGGVVSGDDGSTVAIAPGALAADTPVGIAARTEAELPLDLPEGLNFAAAFDVEFGDQPLQVGAQLAVRVPETVVPGTRMYFFRAATLPDENGNEFEVWMQVDAGIVGEDGFARTTSPPFSGIDTSGRYFAGSGVQEFVGARLTSARAAAASISDAFLTIGSVGGAILAAPLGMLATQFVDAYFEYLVGSYELKIYSVPKEGLPQVTATQVELAAGRVNDVVVSVPSTLPADGAWSPPAITVARFEFADADGALRPQLVLEGERFTYDNPLAPADKKDGSQFEDVRVQFSVPGSNQPIKLQAVSGDGSELVVDLSDDQSRAITLGLAEISVVRPQYLRGDGSWSNRVHKESNAIRVQQTLHHAFAALGGNEVAVIDARLPGTGDEGLNLVARIPLSGGPTRAVTVTPDLTRAYVTQRFGGAVSVIDTTTLQEIDTIPDDPDDPDSQGINPIQLPPGANPFWITVDPRGFYVYVSDDRQGVVYAIDTNPSSPDYHTVKTLSFSGTFTGAGLRGLDVSADGKRLYVAAPGQTLFSKPQGAPELGSILVVNTDVASDQFFEEVWVIPDVGREPYGVTATNDPRRITFTNRLQDTRGFGVLEADESATNWSTRYVGLHLGSPSDAFDVNNGQGIAVTSDLQWAFITGYNRFIPGIPSHDPYFDPLQPGGSNVGIIRDPFGLEGTPQLVAATRPIPVGFADNLVLTPDDRHLFVAYPGLPRAVFVYDVREIIDQIESPANAHLLARGPINDLVYGERTNNLLIDIRADYRLLSINLGFAEFGIPDHDPANGIFNSNAPIGTGGTPRGLAIAFDPLALLPVEAVGPTPTFNWEKNPGFEDATSRLFVSSFGPGDGLWPDDTPLILAKIDPALLENATAEELAKLVLPEGALPIPGGLGDANYTRIVNGLDMGQDTTFTLSEDRSLTAGQTYYWGVELTAPDGKTTKKWGTFRVPIPEPINSDTFSSVTVITHGWSVPWFDRNVAADYLELAEQIARIGGGGVVGHYQKETGTYEWQNDLEPQAGRPLVLVNDWIVDSSISDTGFAEAAADAFFAALVQLNIDQSEKVFNSPIHLIAFSRGTTVTGEIAQRLGTHFPEIGVATDLHVTTLDPHDIRQDSLNFHLGNALRLIGRAGELVSNVPIPFVEWLGAAIQEVAQIGETASSALGIEQVRYDDFIDPKIQRWENITFHDNYFQEVARTSTQTLTMPDLAVSAISGLFGGGPLVTLSPNGRSIPQADIDLRLGSSSQGVQRTLGPLEPEPTAHDADQARAGFTHDVDFDILGFGLTGLGGVHQRVKRWYAGTVNLALPGFERNSDDSGYVEMLFRMLAHRHEDWNKHFDDIGLPWYTAHVLSDGMPESIVHGDPQRPWEGIGEGFYYTVLGGGVQHRPQSGESTPVTFDNTTSAGGDLPVPTIFNGNFDATVRPVLGRFPVGFTAWAEIPGWSFHNGQTEGTMTQGTHLVPVGTIPNPHPNTNDGQDFIDYALRMGALGDFPLDAAVGLPINVPIPNTKLTEITHNRMYVPDWVELLRIDVMVEQGAENGVLEVFLDSGDVPSQAIGTVELRQPMSDFETFYFQVPDPLPGTVAQPRLKLGGDAVILVDNVFFAFGSFSDSSGVADDGVVLFTKNADESAVTTPLMVYAATTGGTPLIAAQQGELLVGQHYVEWTNNSNWPVNLRNVTVSGNPFLVHHPHHIAPHHKELLNSGVALPVTEPLAPVGYDEILPGQTVKWIFSAEPRPGLLPSLTTQQVLMYEADLSFDVEVIFSQNDRFILPTRHSIDFLGVLDVADSNNRDNTLE
ncbi:MAG: hypothetical protein EA424_04310, partial [Planctomycetaceae bacterium]